MFVLIQHLPEESKKPLRREETEGMGTNRKIWFRLGCSLWLNHEPNQFMWPVTLQLPLKGTTVPLNGVCRKPEKQLHSREVLPTRSPV